MFMRDREAAVIGALAVLSAVMCLVFLGRMLALWRLYLLPSYRRDATAVLSNLRRDTGWGLSNFDIRSGQCRVERCELALDFAYHGPKRIKPPSSEFRVTWTKGKPETYVVQVQ